MSKEETAMKETGIDWMDDRGISPDQLDAVIAACELEMDRFDRDLFKSQDGKFIEYLDLCYILPEVVRYALSRQSAVGGDWEKVASEIATALPEVTNLYSRIGPILRRALRCATRTPEGEMCCRICIENISTDPNMRICQSCYDEHSAEPGFIEAVSGKASPPSHTTEGLHLDGIDVFYSEEDSAWIARLQSNHGISAFADTAQGAVVELAVAMSGVIDSPSTATGGITEAEIEREIAEWSASIKGKPKFSERHFLAKRIASLIERAGEEDHE